MCLFIYIYIYPLNHCCSHHDLQPLNMFNMGLFSFFRHMRLKKITRGDIGGYFFLLELVLRLSRQLWRHKASCWWLLQVSPLCCQCSSALPRDRQTSRVKPPGCLQLPGSTAVARDWSESVLMGFAACNWVESIIKFVSRWVNTASW